MHSLIIGGDKMGRAAGWSAPISAKQRFKWPSRADGPFGVLQLLWLLVKLSLPKVVQFRFYGDPEQTGYVFSCSFDRNRSLGIEYPRKIN
jgi:hypothetical protein